MNKLSKKEILKKRAEALALSFQGQDDKGEFLEIVSFKLDQENFAIQTIFIKEIYPLKEFTFLPCAPPFVYGVTNVRRNILPIIDLKIFFSLPNDPNITKQLLIMKNESVELAILIDGFSSIRTVSKNELQPSLPTLTGTRQEFLKGLLVDGTVILDGEKILTSPLLIIDTNLD